MGSGEENLRLLSRVEGFAGVEPRELEQLGHVAVARSYDRGEVLFREGDGGDTCYVIRTGAVLLTRGHDDGREIALAELRAGSMFGELALFGGERRSATAQTVEETEVVALLGADVERLVRSHPDMALAMLSSMAARVRSANERLLTRSFLTVPGRVAEAVLSQVAARQDEGAPEQDVLVRATQAEIASLAGTSRESASRFLATLEREGVVSLGRGKVTVHEPARLRNFIH